MLQTLAHATFGREWWVKGEAQLQELPSGERTPVEGHEQFDVARRDDAAGRRICHENGESVL